MDAEDGSLKIAKVIKMRLDNYSAAIVISDERLLELVSESHVQGDIPFFTKIGNQLYYNSASEGLVLMAIFDPALHAELQKKKPLFLERKF